MAHIGNVKKVKKEAALARRLQRGATKMAAKAQRQSLPKRRWF
jgi:hypothetical protein